MPKLRILGRPTPPASPSPRQRLMPAGNRLYRTIQRPDVFCWHDEPESGPVPQLSRRAKPNRAKTVRRPSGMLGKKTRVSRRGEPPVADVPADAFVAWLGRLYGPRR